MVRTGPGKEAQRWAEASERYENYLKQVAVMQAAATAERGIVEAASNKLVQFVKDEAERQGKSVYTCAIVMTNGEVVVGSLSDKLVVLDKLDTFAS